MAAPASMQARASAAISSGVVGTFGLAAFDVAPLIANGPVFEQIRSDRRAFERVGVLLSSMIDREARKHAAESATGSLIGLGHDLRAPLRASESDEPLKAAIREAITRKPKGHDFVIDRNHKRPAVARHMSVTGG